jgi:hypothetical protein
MNIISTSLARRAPNSPVVSSVPKDLALETQREPLETFADQGSHFSPDLEQGVTLSFITTLIGATTGGMASGLVAKGTNVFTAIPAGIAIGAGLGLAIGVTGALIAEYQ